MVWMIPTSENQQFIVITLMTWLIAVTGAMHIVAGSMEAYVLALAGEWAWWQVITPIRHPGSARQYRGSDRALCADLLRAGDERDLADEAVANLDRGSTHTLLSPRETGKIVGVHLCCGRLTPGACCRDNAIARPRF